MRPLGDLFQDLYQIAYVTADVDEAIASFDVLLGLAWRKDRAEVDGMIVDGTRHDGWVVDFALADAGTTNFELFQPVSDGPLALYGPSIRPGTPYTFHHLAFRIPDFDEASAILHENGKTWRMRGENAGRNRFGYVDMTKELGYYVELVDYEMSDGGHS